MKGGAIFASVVLAAMILVIKVSMGYSSQTRQFPILIAAVVSVLAAIEIVVEVRDRAKKQAVPSEKRKTAGRGTLAKYLEAPAWLAAVLLLVYLLGLLAGLPFYIFLYLKLHGEKWLTTAIDALIAAAVVYVFQVGLGVSLYEGLLFS